MGRCENAPDTGIALLELHLERIKASAAELGFAFDRHAARNQIHALSTTGILGLTTAQVSSFLTADDDLMAETNRIRSGFALRPLRRSR